METNEFNNAFVFQIRSNKNDHFGTAFAIYHDDESTYFITCQHVIDDVDNTEEIFISGNIRVKIIANDSVKDGFDIALLKTDVRLDIPIYPINSTVNHKNTFVCLGFHSNGAKQKIVELVHGRLVPKGIIESIKHGERIPSFSFDVYNNSPKFLKGYSGSPVIDKDTKCVVGIVNIKNQEGNQGAVISIDAIRQISPILYEKIKGNNETLSVADTENFTIKDLSEENLRKTIFNDKYSKHYDYFYIRRDLKIDKQIETLIDCDRNIWIFGNSGVGKTTMILRQKLHSDIDFHYYYASTHINLKNVSEIFEDILAEFIDDDICRNENINILKKIAIALNNKYQGRKVIFLIDELNNLTESIFSEFVEMTVALSQEYGNLNDSNEKIIFWISTLNDPQKVCKNLSKARESFKFIKLLDWESTDIENLFTLITSALNFNFQSIEIKYFLKKIKNPRDLKTCLQNFLRDDDLNLIDIVDEFSYL